MWSRSLLKPFCSLVLVQLFLCLPSKSFSAEMVVMNIVLNQEQKGEFFVHLTDDGDFLAKVEDLKTCGINDPKGEVSEIEGESYISLRSMEGLTFVFNEKTLSIEITAKPSLLPKTNIDFTPARQSNVYYPRDNSAFLNYRLNYAESISPDAKNMNLANQMGIRSGDYLFLSDSSYAKTDVDNRFVRLMTNVTHDRRSDMKRVVYGDFFSSSGDLGSSLNMGGISYSKVYRIDPYFIRYPMLDISGSASLPSEVDVYLDGMKIRTERLSPGEFELRNISHYGGASTVEVVIRDVFGREERIIQPFYFTDTLLKEGLHEYSYDIGLLREDFGVESNRYGEMAMSFFHRYGMNDRFTVGFRGEGGSGLFNIGPQGSYLLGDAGIFTGSMAGSMGEEGFGLAFSLSHSYQNRKVNTRLSVKGYTEEYSTTGSGLLTEKPKYEAGAGIGYNAREFGSISIDYTTLKGYEGGDRDVASATYNKSIMGKVSVFLTLRNIKEEESSSEVFAGLSYYPWSDTSLSANYQKVEEKTVEAIMVQKNTPSGEGFSYRATVEKIDSPDGSAGRVNPFLQYNSRRGILSAEYSAVSGEGEETRISQITASGAVVYVGDDVRLTRPVYDSFGLVKVGSLEGIRVYQSGQEIGRTDSSGRLLIPSLGSYYDNLVSIEDKDIPMNFTISEVQKYISPPLGSGSLIDFDVTKFQAITGTLMVKADGEIKPVEYREVNVTVDGKDSTFPTGKGGEFYLENMKAGIYKATFEHYKKTCFFDIIIPESEETIIDLGGITCEDIH